MKKYQKQQCLKKLKQKQLGVTRKVITIKKGVDYYKKVENELE